jgi:hypothetical protein
MVELSGESPTQILLESTASSGLFLTAMKSSIQLLRGMVSACLLMTSALLGGGCTTFHYDWQKAAQEPKPGDIQGRWQGVWVSEASGHNDQLRAVITRKVDGNYVARFHAKYRKVMSFGYTVPLNVEATGGGFKFSGQANLGWLAGGIYHYNGHANTTNFFSTYTSKYDHGTFQMGRP